MLLALTLSILGVICSFLDSGQLSAILFRKMPLETQIKKLNEYFVDFKQILHTIGTRKTEALPFAT